MSLLKGQTVPDIILIHDTWLAKLAAEQKIQPLDGGLSIERENALAGMADAMVWEGKTILALLAGYALLYYRTDLVETPPAAWEDLFQLALQIMKANEMEYGLVFLDQPRKTQQLSGRHMALLRYISGF